jgi:hypothetical protein
MSKTTTTQENTTVTTVSPFDTLGTTTATTDSRLSYTPALIAKANDRAQQLMLVVSKKPELHAMANAVLTGDAQDLIDLINAVYDDATIALDAKILEGADDDTLSRLLESRRSDRSKTKAKGPGTSALVCKSYIATMYAELLVRQAWGKPYSSAASTIDMDDVDAVGRKIRSLQSKKSRLAKLAQYDVKASDELQEIEAEIARLNGLRPATRVVTRTSIKDVEADTLRDTLKLINRDELSEEDAKKLDTLLAKLG